MEMYLKISYGTTTLEPSVQFSSKRTFSYTLEFRPAHAFEAASLLHRIHTNATSYIRHIELLLLLLAAGCWLLAAGCWLLAAGCWLLAAGCWLLAAGCWLLAAGCWLLAAGCYSLIYIHMYNSTVNHHVHYIHKIQSSQQAFDTYFKNHVPMGDIYVTYYSL